MVFRIESDARRDEWRYLVGEASMRFGSKGDAVSYAEFIASHQSDESVIEIWEAGKLTERIERPASAAGGPMSVGH